MSVKNTDRAKLAGGVLFHLCFSVILVFLLPLKFSNMIGVPEVPIIVEDPWIWLLESYPPLLFPIISVIYLISAIFAAGWNFKIRVDFGWHLVFLCLLLAFVSLIGFLNASVLDFPIIFSLHFFGLAIFAWAVKLTLTLRKDMGIILLRALVLGTLAATFRSLHQLLFGFQQSLEFVKNAQAETGVRLSWDLMNRMEQTRVFAPFTLCNSLAAHLILMIPLVSVMIFYDKLSARLAMIISALSLFFIFFDTGNMIYLSALIVIFAFVMSLALTSFFEENYKKLCLVLSVAATIFLLYILKHTFSRAAVLSFAIALSFLPFFVEMKRWKKVLYLCGVFAAGIIFFVIVNQDRKILEQSSLHVRIDYWLRAAEMFRDNIVAGVGWGDFFHKYILVKKFPGVESPHTAHNIVLDFASQCGLFALIAIVLLYFFTIYYIARAGLKRGGEPFRFCGIAIFTGICAWLIHSLTDLNFQLPGTVASAIIMSLVSVEILAGGRKDYEIRFANFAIAGIAFLILAAALWRMRGEFYYSRLYQICEPVVINKEAPEKYSLASMQKALYEAVDAMPYSPFPWAAAGNYCQRRAIWDLSEKYFNEALKKSPERASFYYRLGVSQFAQGKYYEGLENIRKASELFPNNEEYRSQYFKIKQRLLEVK